MQVERKTSAHDPAALLDPQSRQAVRGFLTRASGYVAFAAFPWLLGPRTPTDMGARLVAVFALGGAFAMVLGALHNEEPGRGALNRWDEAMAFNGLSLLMHLLTSLSG